MKESPLEKIKKMIDNDLSIEEAFEIISWKEFENAVAEIFRLHGFSVRQNVYVNGTKKYQIDLVAENNLKIFLVDCKQWSKHRYKKSQLKRACLKQKERALYFSLNSPRKEIVPLIVTLLDENFYNFEGVFIVPLFKLNHFLLNY